MKSRSQIKFPQCRMDSQIPLILSSILLLFSLSTASKPHQSILDSFPKCVAKHSDSLILNSTAFFTAKTASYNTNLQSTAQNLRCLLPSMPKPLLIFTPLSESHVRAAVICAKQFSIHVRIRSGGHDYDCISYTSHFKSPSPFIMLDLQKLRAVDVNIQNNTAWVQAGATIGELYYWIAQNSQTHGYPAGLWHSVGIGGHITGGGYGSMVRKYGLAADNVVDAQMVDAFGNILDRKSMGEDVFWAIRGGGGGSFGVILAWKVKLVRVPPIVTVFNVAKTLEQGATNILYKWQQVADKLDENLSTRVLMHPVNSTKTGKRTVQTIYNALFLGRANRLLQIMNKGFPEMGLTQEGCIEMSWIESVLYIAEYPRNTLPEVLLQRQNALRTYFKAKSDFIRNPIPKHGLEGLWKLFLEEESPVIIWTSFGGKMSRISESEIAFPHRKGVIFMAQYWTSWQSEEESVLIEHYEWMTRMYNYMASYAPKHPREAYVNYRDVELGMNNKNSSFVDGSKWGYKYFKTNFNRLIQVKSRVDPDNFFWHEQSIPVMPLSM